MSQFIIFQNKPFFLNTEHQPCEFDLAKAFKKLHTVYRFSDEGYDGRKLSVMEHSLCLAVLLARRTREEDRETVIKAALLHDIHEAAIGDFPTPIKRAVPELGAMSGYAQRSLLQSFDLFSHYEYIKDIEDQEYEWLSAEAHWLLNKQAAFWIAEPTDVKADEFTEVLHKVHAFITQGSYIYVGLECFVRDIYGGKFVTEWFNSMVTQNRDSPNAV